METGQNNNKNAYLYINPNYLRHKVLFILFSTRSTVVYYIRLLKRNAKRFTRWQLLFKKCLLLYFVGQTYQFKNIRKPETFVVKALKRM